jgi:hypothetical protein
VKFLPYVVRYLLILALGFSFFLMGVGFLFNDTGASTFAILKVFWWMIPIILFFVINEYLIKNGLLRSLKSFCIYGIFVVGIVSVGTVLVVTFL